MAPNPDSQYYYWCPPATCSLSLDLCAALQFLSSSSSAGEKLQCCAAPENMSVENMLCSSKVGSMPRHVTLSAGNDLQPTKKGPSLLLCHSQLDCIYLGHEIGRGGIILLLVARWLTSCLNFVHSKNAALWWCILFCNQLTKLAR